MKVKEWIEQFKERVATANVKLWHLTSTREWRYIEMDEEMPKGRMQLQIGLAYFDFYNSQ